MYVRRLLRQIADFDALYPWVHHDFFDGRPQLGIWSQHLPYERPAGPWRQVVDRRRALRLRCYGRRARLDVRSKELVGLLRDRPRQLLEVEAVIDNTARPDIDKTRVVGCTAAQRQLGHEGARFISAALLTFAQELLRSDVRFTPAKARGHVYRLLPRKSVHCRRSVVADLAPRGLASL